jgi:hypothetical protein
VSTTEAVATAQSAPARMCLLSLVRCGRSPPLIDPSQSHIYRHLALHERAGRIQMCGTKEQGGKTPSRYSRGTRAGSGDARRLEGRRPGGARAGVTSLIPRLVSVVSRGPAPAVYRARGVTWVAQIVRPHAIRHASIPR